jgi:hypothetical protein
LAERFAKETKLACAGKTALAEPESVTEPESEPVAANT